MALEIDVEFGLETMTLDSGIEIKETLEYVENDHSQLRNRDAANQHPIEAITGLQETLESLESGSIKAHGDLTGRDQPDQHPMSAISSLEKTLSGKLTEDTIEPLTNQEIEDILNSFV